MTIPTVFHPLPFTPFIPNTLPGTWQNISSWNPLNYRDQSISPIAYEAVNSERLTDLPQVEVKWQSQDAPQIYATQSQCSLTPDTSWTAVPWNLLHLLLESTRPTQCWLPGLGNDTSLPYFSLRLLPVYTCAWTPTVTGKAPYSPGLMHSQWQCPQGAWGCHNNGDGDPVTSTLPRHLWPWGTHKSKNEKKQMWSLSRLLCPDFLEVWSGSQELLD